MDQKSLFIPISSGMLNNTEPMTAAPHDIASRSGRPKPSCKEKQKVYIRNRVLLDSSQTHQENKLFKPACVARFKRCSFILSEIFASDNKLVLFTHDKEIIGCKLLSGLSQFFRASNPPGT